MTNQFMRITLKQILKHPQELFAILGVEVTWDAEARLPAILSIRFGNVCANQTMIV